MEVNIILGMLIGGKQPDVTLGSWHATGHWKDDPPDQKGRAPRKPPNRKVFESYTRLQRENDTLG
jgi:hypothetical protein